jgi:energy-coupling factor transport system ATP-binding protein
VSDIAVSGVTYAYPSGVRALDAVDLTIGPGEAVAIIGQNGSGKTTLVRHFNGLLKPDVGTVTVDRWDTRYRPVALLAHDVALAFQDPDRQIFAGSVAAEVGFGARNIGLKGDALETAISSALETVGLAAERKTNPYDLGFSRRKLLTIASVLAMQTPVVVLDEPTTGQDARGVRIIESIVAALEDAGRTVVAVSHDMRFVAACFERVVVMREGNVVADGSRTEVFAELSWETLRSTNLRPPYAAFAGARLGLGSTPTDQSVAEAFLARSDGVA